MAFVPQRVSLSGNLVVAADEIRLVDATGSLPIWKRSAFPPLDRLDALWVERVRSLPPDRPVRVDGWYKAFPFRRLQVVSVVPAGGEPGEIRSATERACAWGLYGLGALLLVVAAAVPVATARPRVEWSLSREQAAPAAEAWVRLGVDAAHRGAYTDARKYLTQAVEGDLESVVDDRAVADAQFNLAVLSLVEQRTEEARKRLGAALAKDPRHEAALEAQELLERGLPFDRPGLAAAPGK
jgi:tetratricopeptide (TPR) repeat protein